MEVPGQYGSVPPPDLAAERAKIKQRVRDYGRALDEGTGNVLDPDIDTKLRQWQGEIDIAHQNRLLENARELEDIAPTLTKLQAKLAAVEEQHAMASQSRETAYQALTGRSWPVVTDGATPSAVAMMGSAPLPRSSSMVDPQRAYANEGQTSGLSIGDVLHYALLALAGAADFVAFYQVLALVLGAVPEMLLTAVLAVTFIALALMHQAGNTLRDWRFRAASGRIWVATVCLVGWTALGAGAYYLRLKTEDDTGSNSALLDFGGLGVIDESSTVQTKALVFLVIFVTTGVLALIGAYLTRNPLRSAFRKANRACKRLRGQLTKAKTAHGSVEQQNARLTKMPDSEKLLRQAALDHRAALACGLKSCVREEIAIRLQDPEATQYLLQQPIPGCGDVPANPRQDSDDVPAEPRQDSDATAR